MPMIRLFLIASTLTLLAPGAASAQDGDALALAGVRAESPAASPRFSGTYRFVSGRRSIQRSVDAVANAFDFFTRAFARPILEERNQPYAQVQLDVGESSSRFSLGEWGPVHTRFGATRTVTNERGERVRVRQFMRGGRLVQTLTTDQGTRTNTLSLSADGRRLVIETRITSPRLPMPLRYRLVYERAGGDAAVRVAMR